MHWLDIKLDQTQFHATECKLLDNTTTLLVPIFWEMKCCVMQKYRQKRDIQEEVEFFPQHAASYVVWKYKFNCRNTIRGLN